MGTIRVLVAVGVFVGAIGTATARDAFPMPVGAELRFGMSVALFKRVCPDAEIDREAAATTPSLQVFNARTKCRNPMFGRSGETTYAFEGGALNMVTAALTASDLNHILFLAYGAGAAACWAGQRDLIASPPTFTCETATFSVLAAAAPQPEAKKRTYRAVVTAIAR